MHEQYKHHNPEKNSFESHILDLLEGGPNTLENFTNSVHSNYGEITVLVHPYYNRDARNVFHTNYQSSQEYNSKRDRLIEETTSPLIIFEDIRFIDLLPINIPLTTPTVYTVTTEVDDPAPKAYYAKHSENTWETLSQVLTQANVKKVHLGGLLLHMSHYSTLKYQRVPLPNKRQSVSAEEAHNTLKQYISRISKEQNISEKNIQASEWVHKGIIPFGCVGETAIQLLHAGFDVEFSSATE